jgi:hypothetical protein
MTMEEYNAQQKAQSAGLLKKAEARKHEEVKGKLLERKEEKNEKVTTLTSELKDANMYNTGIARSEHADLLGFQG